MKADSQSAQWVQSVCLPTQPKIDFPQKCKMLNIIILGLPKPAIDFFGIPQGNKFNYLDSSVTNLQKLMNFWRNSKQHLTPFGKVLLSLCYDIYPKISAGKVYLFPTLVKTSLVPPKSKLFLGLQRSP